MTTVRARRVYEAPEAADGKRVLVDRLWPRGLAKAAAHLDEWLKAVDQDPPAIGRVRRLVYPAGPHCRHRLLRGVSRRRQVSRPSSRMTRSSSRCSVW